MQQLDVLTLADVIVCCIPMFGCLLRRSNKIRTERRGAPVFSCLVEVLSHDTLRLHSNVAASVDALLAGKQPATQLRKHRDGTFIVRFETPEVGTKGKGGRPVVPASWLASLAKMAQQSADPMSWVY